MMKRLFSLLSKPLPGWLTIVLFCSMATALATTVPTFYGRVCTLQAACATGSNATDGTIARSASTGALYFGTNGNQALDFGVNNSGRWTFGGNNTVQATGYGTNGAFPVANGDITAGGHMEAQSDGAHSSYVPPLYTTAGAAVASTGHSVYWTTTYTISGTCANNTSCTPTSGSSVSLTGAAAFAGTGTAACGASDEGTAGFVPSAAINGGGAGIQVTLYNGTGSGQTGTVALNVVCTGT